VSKVQNAIVLAQVSILDLLTRRTPKT